MINVKRSCHFFVPLFPWAVIREQVQREDRGREGSVERKRKIGIEEAIWKERKNERARESERGKLKGNPSCRSLTENT